MGRVGSMVVMAAIVLASMGVPAANGAPTVRTRVQVSDDRSHALMIRTGESAAVLFTLTTPAEGATVEIPVASLECQSCSGEFYLTSDFGPGTDAATLVDAGSYSVSDPVASSGLTLPAGDYALVVTISSGSALWLGTDSIPPSGQDASDGPDFHAATTDPGYPPASDFQLLVGEGNLAYRVTDTVDDGTSGEDPDPLPVLEVTPESATRALSRLHEVAATVVDPDGGPVSGLDLTFTIAGAHPGSSVIATGADGTAVLSYRGSRVGEDTVTVSADVDRNGTADLSSAVSVTWEDRYGMVLAPEVAERPRGAEHTVTATLTNDGSPVEGQGVTFVVEGAHPQSRTVVTDADGVASLRYVSEVPGTDDITACAYVDDDGTCGIGASAAVTWTNTDPDCTSVRPSRDQLAFNNHHFAPVELAGGVDGDGDGVTLTVVSVQQDEPVNGRGDGNTSPDARLLADAHAVELRQERSGRGDGRVYLIGFEGRDGHGGSCEGEVIVTVPHDHSGRPAVDSGWRTNSLAG